MDVDAFRQFLKEGGRSATAALRAIDFTTQFETYLSDHGLDLDDAGPADLESFVADVEAEPGVSAKLHLWGLRYYYEFIDDPVMVHVAGAMRRQRVEQTPFRLRQFRGVNQTTTDRLATIGIRSIEDLLSAAGTRSQRTALAGTAAISLDDLEELVRLSDLARIRGLKGIRARLYLDAGIRSVTELAGWDPVELVAMLQQHIGGSGFDGIAPLPGEAQHAVQAARALEPVVEW
ncbi:MAG: DUF4332 domain-containing protein [Acidimicrobiia bacterium]|nr:DUF4332 domain-containing protein [Acidimicrobiia bacterium]